MSFSNNLKPDKMPGPIVGNPMSGLCDKVCLQAKKVFDACIKQETLQNQTITLTSTVPPTVTQPLTFVSAKSTTSYGRVTNLTVDKMGDDSGCARVRCDVTIPLEVVFIDANGVDGKGYADLVISKDVILHISEPSVIPFEIEAVVSCVCPEATYTGDNTFVMSACVTCILKVVMEVELLVPSYGYCYIPPCQEFKEEVCEGFFDLPLYPQDDNCR